MTDTFPARFEGICVDCHQIIHVGHEIVRTDDAYSHAACEIAPPEPDRPVCTRCWQQIAINGACGCDQS